MEGDLRAAVTNALEQNVSVKDICFSGNGEPSLSPFFPEALERAGRVRAERAPQAELVLITNGAGLLEPEIFSLLEDAALSFPQAGSSGPINIWLKLDAGTSEWYKKMNATAIPFEKLIAKIREFVVRAPVTIQTMLCAIDDSGPPPEEEQAWETLVLELVTAAKTGGRIRKVQIYGKARPAPEDPKAEALPVEYLERRAASLRALFAEANNGAFAGTEATLPPVEVYP